MLFCTFHNVRIWLENYCINECQSDAVHSNKSAFTMLLFPYLQHWTRQRYGLFRIFSPLQSTVKVTLSFLIVSWLLYSQIALNSTNAGWKFFRGWALSSHETDVCNSLSILNKQSNRKIIHSNGKKGVFFLSLNFLRRI